MGEGRQWARVITGRMPLDLLHTRIVRPFARHLHAEYAIGVCLDGVEEIGYRGAVHRSWPGTVVVLEPGEVHDGGPGGAGGFRYRVMYPGPVLFGDRAPHFRRPVIEDVELAGRLRRAHRILGLGADPLLGESLLVELLGELVVRHADRPVGSAGDAAPGRRDQRVPARLVMSRLVMARLGDEPVSPPSLAEIAAELGLSRYQLLRGFTEQVGLPPYAWLAQHRVAMARRLLEQGDRPSQVAVSVGFADQAHLTRWFRRVVGVTPAVYRNGVQDRVR